MGSLDTLVAGHTLYICHMSTVAVGSLASMHFRRALSCVIHTRGRVLLIIPSVH